MQYMQRGTGCRFSGYPNRKLYGGKKLEELCGNEDVEHFKEQYGITGEIRKIY